MSYPILRELGELQRRVPRSDATPAQIAAWYAGKGRLLAHIAADSGPDGGDALEQSRVAYAHAEALTQGVAA
ncbi:MAG: hypothetical protein ACRDRL_03440 [Sciscionella sp.]